MKVLIVGNGGREHALCWKVAQSNKVSQIYVANGNAGTANEPKSQNIDIEPTDIEALVTFAKNNNIALTLIGPEAPLALGITDKFNKENLACFGPTKLAAQLESSKQFCKEFMQAQNIPTAKFATFTEATKAIEFLKAQKFPLVIKADGLAAGKGVVIAETEQQAIEAINEMLLNQKFGCASQTVVIEEFIEGEELSFIAMVDGENILPLASSQDHKRRDEGDKGPNTGGMGAYSPAPLLTPELNNTIIETVIKPTVAGMNQANTPYVGFLYAGLMITPEGIPKVLEFNCRLGDPETQPILFRLKTDLVELCLAALNQSLNQVSVEWDPRPALTVVLASGGYPDQYRQGDTIEGLEQTTPSDVKIFHAGTKQTNTHVIATGGRVLSVTAIGSSLSSARDKAYTLAETITWPDRFYRKDIGHRALAN